MNAQQIATNNLRQQITQELGQISMELPDARARLKQLEQRDVELRTALSTLSAVEKETANAQAAIDRVAMPAPESKAQDATAH